MTAVLTAAETENLRYHLGFGNVSIGGYPYTPDGYFELFTNVIAQYLTSGATTTSSTVVSAAGIVEITPASMAGISTYVRLVIDVAPDEETVVVRAATATTFSATFTKAHAAPFAIEVESGVTRLRTLLTAADRALADAFSGDTAATAGVKKVDEIEFFQALKGGTTLLSMAGKLEQYRRIVLAIADLVRVRPRWEVEDYAMLRREVY
jgi:hypothetical protein